MRAGARIVVTVVRWPNSDIGYRSGAHCYRLNGSSLVAVNRSVGCFVLGEDGEA